MPEDPLLTMRKLDPVFMKHISDTDALVFAEGALPRCIKLLIAMAFDAANGAPGGVRALAEQALTCGATKEQVAEALRVAFHLSGVGSLYAASFGLKDLLG